MRDDGVYMVNRAPMMGWPATYTLVKLGKPWPPRNGVTPGWDDSQIVGCERGVTKENHRAAWARLMEKCDA